jgi:FkbM family methyltransferase
MIELDVPLAWLARRVRPVPGARRLIHRLQRHFARRYRGTAERWTTLRDFDGGGRIQLNRAAHMGSSIYWNGYYSLNEIAVLRDLLREDSVFVDAGAHAGEFTLVAARRSPSGRVLAFEPAPAVFGLLERNIELNGFTNAEAYAIALSDAPGWMDLYDGSAGVDQDFDDDIVCTQFEGFGREHHSARVPAEPFDQVAARLSIQRLDVMKLDVEGGEVRILRGAMASLRRFRPQIILEVAEPLLRAAGNSVEELFDIIEELGYRVFLITDYRLRDQLEARTLRRFGRLVEVNRRTVPGFSNVLCRPV